MFEVIVNGLYIKTTLGNYGNQDVGISPCGAMDKFSFLTGNILLGNPENSPALEIIYPPLFKVINRGVFILTGAPSKDSYIKRGDKKIKINNNQVYAAEINDQIYIGDKTEGLRTYLCYRELSDHHQILKLVGRKRGDFNKSINWYPKDGLIRVIKGPEYKYLNNPEDFFNNYWVVSKDTNNMGMRLESKNKLDISLKNMISEAVADGTIQVTPNGPIILLRHRQTIGGYPRCFNIISSDLDILAQYCPGQLLRFKLVTMNEALIINQHMKNDLDRLRDKYNS